MKRLFWMLMLTGVGLTAAAGSSWGQNVGVYGPGVRADAGVYGPNAGVHINGTGVHSGYYNTQYNSGYYQGTGYYQGGQWQGGSYHQGSWNDACCPTGYQGGYGGHGDFDYDDDCDD